MHPHYPKRRRCVCHTNPIVAPSGCIPGSQPPVLPSPGFSSPSQLCLLHLLTGKELCPAHLRSFSTFPSCFKPSSSLRSQTMGDVTMTASKFIEHLQYTRCCAKHFIIYNPKNPMWIPIISILFSHTKILWGLKQLAEAHSAVGWLNGNVIMHSQPLHHATSTGLLSGPRPLCNNTALAEVINDHSLRNQVPSWLGLSTGYPLLNASPSVSKKPPHYLLSR